MKTILTAVSVIVMACSLSAQVRYLPGYFLNNEGIRTNCLIKNIDWKNNPTSFTYKLAEGNAEQIGDIKDVSEFGIINELKYVRAQVNIDRSSSDLATLSRSKSPEYKNETVFLKEIVKGAANLYMYEEEHLLRYFYKTSTREIEELLFKQYYMENGLVGTNNGYLQQLINNVKCDQIPEAKILSVPYDNINLKRYFLEYNKCVDPSYKNAAYNKKQKIYFVAKAGINSSTLKVNDRYAVAESLSFGNKITPRFSLGVEYIPPFLHNSLSVLAEIAYQYYKNEIVKPSGFYYDTARIDYRSVEIPLTARKYLFLTSNLKMFLDAGIIVDLPFKSYFTPLGRTKLEINTAPSYLVGTGVQVNRVSLELRYNFKRKILAQYPGWKTNFSSFNVNAAVRIF